MLQCVPGRMPLLHRFLLMTKSPVMPMLLTIISILPVFLMLTAFAALVVP